MNIKHVLLTTDFSDNARKAYPCATSLTRKLGAKLHLVHFAGVMPTVVLGSSSEYFYEVREQALRNEAATHPAFEGIEVVAHLEPHRWTPERHHSLERKQDIDIVVMGTHGRTGVQHFLLGSFAERVLRNSSVPVLVCREPEARAKFEPKLIVVPYDFSDVSEAILPSIRFFSSNFECRFRFLYVYEPVPPRNFPIVEAVRQFLKERPRQPIEDRFTELVNTQLSDVDVTLETSQGVPSEEIVSRARDLGADLVLVGTHGVLGSVAQTVTREASCSVLTIPKPRVDAAT